MKIQHGRYKLHRTGALAALGLSLALSVFAVPPGVRSLPQNQPKEPTVTNHARGTFDVKMSPQAPEEKVGDPTVQLGLWLRDRKEFVGVDGLRQPPSDAAGERSALVIRAHADIVGRVMHTTALDRDHRLLSTVAAAASLVTENARLQAEVLVQLAEVQSSRSRIVAAADAERRSGPGPRPAAAVPGAPEADRPS